MDTATADIFSEEEDKIPQVPKTVDLQEFQKKSFGELIQVGEELGQRNLSGKSKHEVIFSLMTYMGRKGTEITAEGVIEGASRDSFAFLRSTLSSFAHWAEDAYVSPSLMRKVNLQPGHHVTAILRAPKDREKYLAVKELLTIEGMPADQWEDQTSFDKLTPLFPSERIILENPEDPTVSSRVVDIVSPLGKGQRGLIVAPPRGGKTVLLKTIANSIVANHKEVELIILLLDERPEEVTDFEETVPAAVYASTFDEQPSRHAQVAELVLERARRLVENKKDVVILLDSMTRLARGYNVLQGGKGRIGSGGLDPKALQKARKFFGAARNVEEGGSLTILATALVETESRMDEVIFEEFKGTGNMEIHLDRDLVEKRVFPAIHTLKSGTRKDDLLYHPDELKMINLVRRQLAQVPAAEAIELLIRRIRNTTSNAELLLTGLD